VRQTAAEEGATLIDLNASATAFFEALGPETSKRAFVHYPAGSFPRQTGPLADDTHFSAYGAYQLARAVATGIKASGLGLATHLIETTPFDPTQAAAAARDWDLPE
jgi:lysophospholipase L1-like esterase